MGKLPQVRISGCVADSIVDGPGMRFVVFVQGCPHHCPGCHNPQTHDFDGGHFAEGDAILQAVVQDPLTRGATFSGGEPFCQAGPLRAIGTEIKRAGRDLVVYTGYTLERLLQMGKNDSEVSGLLKLADLLIDGPYIEEQRDLTLPFRGSRNQRLILGDEIRCAMGEAQTSM